MTREGPQRRGNGEASLYALVVVAGAALRLGSLGAAPLTHLEASIAWSSWQTANGGFLSPLSTPPSSAALFATQHALFRLTGGAGSDELARAVPALVGCAMLLLPWFLRPVLGGIGVLALASLLALDPWLVGFSRIADGAILATASAWCLVVATLTVSARDVAHDKWRRCWCLAAAFAAGLLATSGPMTWDLLVPASVVAVVGYRRCSERSATGLTGWLNVAAITAVLFATGGLLHWKGLSLVSAGLTSWVGQWSSSAPTSVPLSTLSGLLSRLELLPICLGVAGLFSILARSSAVNPADRESEALDGGPWPRLLLFWTVWGVVMLLRPGRDLTPWLSLEIPLLLMGARMAQRLAEATLARGFWARRGLARVAVAIGGVLLIGVLAGARAVAAPAHGTSEWRPHSWSTEASVRLLARDIENLTSGSPPRRRGVDVVSPGSFDPTLAWYLRLVPGVRWVGAPPLGRQPVPPVVVERVRGDELHATTGGVYRFRTGPSTVELLRLR